MSNILFSFLFAFGAMSLFITSYEANGVNRVLTNFPIEIIENNVYVMESGDKSGIYYQKEPLTAMTNDYFDLLMGKYTNDYEVSVLFLYSDTWGYCIEKQCDAVKITLDAEVFPIHHFHKSLVYYIGEK